VLQLLALLHTQQGRSEDALTAYDILAAEGEIGADLHQARGDRLQGLGRFEAAVEAYDAALAREPARVEALNNRAAALEAMGRLDAALQGFDAVLSIRPDHTQALYNRGGVLTALGRSTEALESYDRVLVLQPDFAPAHNNRALALAALGRFEEAVAGYDTALSLADDASTSSNRSAALRALRRLDEALDSARHALALRPDFPDALNAEGLALAAMNRFEAALASYDRALVLRPDHRDALNNAGVTLAALRRFDEAGVRHEAALALDPSFAEAEYNLGLLALRLGDPAGWARHEARWRRAGQPGPTYPDAQLWLGADDIAGSTLLLHAEQGLGDTIQFARYASHVRARGAKVVLQVQPALKRLVRGLDGADVVVAAVGEPLPPVDRHIPLMSLPLVFGVEGGAPYLQADPAAAALWRERLLADRLRVGLAWAGNPAHGNDANRSIALSVLAPLLARAATFVSLQRDVPPTDVPTLAETGIRPFPASISDFADTAALIDALDLVITVDTSVAHLAAALGRPTWVLLPRFPDWRWGEASDETPWYPTMRLFRQSDFGQWGDVVEVLGAALDLVIASRAA